MGPGSSPDPNIYYRTKSSRIHQDPGAFSVYFTHSLVVEQSHAGEGHDHALLVALRDDQIIADRTAGLGDIFHTGGIGPLDVVAEGEERVAAQCHIAAGSQPGLLVTFGQALGPFGEVVLPDAIGANVLLVAVDVAVDHVVAIRTAQIGTELQTQRLGMLTQEPGIGLGTRQTGAVDAALLTGADADGLSVIGEANGTPRCCRGSPRHTSAS